jgi:two-component system response regulator AtoC
LHAPHLKDVAAVRTLASDDFIASTPAMLESLYLADAFARTDRTIVLYGETGTGKSLLAEVIHRLSGRVGGLHAISVGTMAPSLVEDELFGHERGAFTDARTARVGLLGESGPGTLRLDDMHGAPPWLQRKLFDVMDRRVYRVLGSDRILAIACRFIITLNEHPDRLVEQGLLIQDLRYRFHELLIGIAPLRQRRDEIPLQAARALARCQKKLPPGGPSRLSDAALAILYGAEWPGNVRQLEGIIERAYLIALKAGRDAIVAADIPDEISPPLVYPSRGTLAEKVEVVRRALDRTDGTVAAAARLLGMSRNTIRTLRKLGSRPTSTAESTCQVST